MGPEALCYTPGVTPVHPIFQLILEGQCEQGLALYRTRVEPTPEDDRWGGYCLFVLGNYLEAKDTLLRSIGRGCVSAGAELVTVLRSMGDTNAAQSALDALLAEKGLAPAERAYALREQAAVNLSDGHVRPAVLALEEAWAVLSGGTGAAERLQVTTAQLLGYAHHLLGRTAPATHYLEFSLRRAVGGARLHPLLTRVQVHLYSGRYDRSQADLEESGALLVAAPGSRPHHAYLTGLLARAQGQWGRALRHFQSSAELARDFGERNTEFLAELGLCTIYTAQRDWDVAELHLSRASSLHETRWESAMYHLREGYFFAATGRPEAAERLGSARQVFTELGLPRETAWAELHLAELHAASDEVLALKFFHHAALNRGALGTVAPLLPEFRLLPRLFALLKRSAHRPDVADVLAERQDLIGDAPQEVRVLTLGRARIEVDGHAVDFGPRRIPEVVAFLLARGPSTRDEILAAVWPDDEVRKARSHLYQAVFALKESVPSLQITYDRSALTYRVVCEGPDFFWDASAIRQALEGGNEEESRRAILSYTEPFLPDVTSEWAREERESLTFSVVDMGLRMIARWTREGEYRKSADLSRRLLMVEPGDQALTAYLVEAVLELDGRAAAQQVLAEAGARAGFAAGSPPPWLAHLSSRLESTLN